jgi:hypothetical protein
MLRGTAHRAGALVQPRSLVDARGDPIGDRKRRVDRDEQVGQTCEVPVGSGAEQVVEVIEVDVDRPHRDARALRDLPGGGPAVAVGHEGEHRVHDRVAGTLRAGGAPVDRRCCRHRAGTVGVVARRVQRCCSEATHPVTGPDLSRQRQGTMR